MQWERLICNKRLGMERYRTSSAQTRSDFQRYFDRLVFSSPFRRLQNKTQVFPLPGSIFVHNRLTHSLEVSSVGKSLANEVYIQLQPKYAGTAAAEKLSHIVEIVGAACLAHDMGNPPFGHSGERTIATYFSEGRGQAIKPLLSDAEWNDFVNFDGNANSFRLLAHQFRGRREGGLAMTYSSLAAIVKYPYTSTTTPKHGKFGFFKSELDCFRMVATELGLIEKSADVFARHPLVYLMEAAEPSPPSATWSLSISQSGIAASMPSSIAAATCSDDKEPLNLSDAMTTFINTLFCRSCHSTCGMP